jgi:steroid 5-alpha reductase family enzyme
MLLGTLLVLLASLTLLWLVSLARRDASLIDPFWGLGFVIIAWLAWLWAPVVTWRTALMVALVSLWGLRLFGYLLWRNWHHKQEDHRYAAMRAKHGQRFWWVSFFTVFMLQGIILWFVSLPVQIVAVKAIDSPFQLWDGLGMMLWLVGIGFEWIGDWQLARFRANPANQGQVLDTGLWRYTRHPNYFGDFCVWWGIYSLAVAGGAGWMILSPLLMSWLLLRVSGVTLLESTIAERRPQYAAYQQRTNAFFPGFPKNSRQS